MLGHDFRGAALLWNISFEGDSDLNMKREAGWSNWHSYNVVCSTDKHKEAHTRLEQTRHTKLRRTGLRNGGN